MHRLRRPAGELWEFPPAVARLGPINFPVSGGGYFRLYPLEMTIRLLERINREGRRPFIFYVHPWELDPDQPRLRAGGVLSRMRHYVNLTSTERKLDALLQRFRFSGVADVLQLSQTDTIAAPSPKALSPAL
jgi:hypothetical protein